MPYLLRQLLFFFHPKKRAIKYDGVDLGLAKLLEDGCLLIPEKSLSTKVANYLRDYILSGPKVSKLGKNGVLLRDTYEQSHLMKNDTILMLATDHDILKLVANYFGSQPKVAFIASWTTYANDPNDIGEMFFHMDHHGHKFLKLFYYLTDVEEGGGHHEYVTKTTDHILNTGRLDIWRTKMPDLACEYETKRRLKGSYRIDEELIIKQLEGDILKIFGKSGTCFIEDTYGLHRGTPIKDGSSRTILQILYVPIVHDKDSKNTVSEELADRQLVKDNIELFDEMMK